MSFTVEVRSNEFRKLTKLAGYPLSTRWQEPCG